MIFAWIEGAGGFSLMNQTVKAALRAWVLSAGQRELRAMLAEGHAGAVLADGATSSEVGDAVPAPPDMTAARFAMRLAGSLVDSYRLGEADELYAIALKACDAAAAQLRGLRSQALELGPEEQRCEVAAVVGGGGGVADDSGFALPPAVAALARQDSAGQLAAVSGRGDSSGPLRGMGLFADLLELDRLELVCGVGELRLKQRRLPEAAQAYGEVAAALEGMRGRLFPGGDPDSPGPSSGPPLPPSHQPGSQPEPISDAFLESLLLVALNGLGNVRAKEPGGGAAAEDLFKRVIAGRTRLLGARSSDTLKAQNDLAGLWLAAGDLVAAEGLFRAVLEGNEAAGGELDPRTLNTVNSLAVVLRKKAEALAKRKPGKPPRVVNAPLARADAGSHSLATPSVAAVKAELRDAWAEAEAFAWRALAGNEEQLGAADPRTLSSASSLVRTWELRGKFRHAAVKIHPFQTSTVIYFSFVRVCVGLSLSLSILGLAAGAARTVRRG